MTVRDISLTKAANSAEMKRVENMVDGLFQWMRGYSSKRSWNPFHWLDVFMIQKYGIKLEADHWLADPKRLGACISNPRLFIINE